MSRYIHLVLFVSLALLSFARQGRNLVAYSDFEISGDLQLVDYTPTPCPSNPILKADREWELAVDGAPYAAPFSGGVWYDEIDRKFKMWYSAGMGKTHGLVTCYAESNDGKQWQKPSLDVVPGTNVVDTLEHDCVTVLLDKQETNQQKRYKMFVVAFNGKATVSMYLKYSSDGIHWSAPRALSGELYDRCSAYYDPFIRKYVLSLKTIHPQYRRARSYLANEDPELLVSLAHRVYDNKSDKFIKYWFNADDLDPRHPKFPEIRPQIYNHDAIPYENQLLGWFVVWQGPENKECTQLNIQKRNEILLGWSSDSFNWVRRNRKPFIGVANDSTAWNSGNVQSTCGSPIVVGDSLYIYYSGRYESKPKYASNFATGVSILRRDGFASLKAGKKGGEAQINIECPIGEYLYVNGAVINGSLIAELIDADGNVVSVYKSPKRTVDSTKLRLEKVSGKGMSDTDCRNCSLRFKLRNAELYSYWFTPYPNGESGGYTAGGGPGLHPSGIDLPKLK